MQVDQATENRCPNCLQSLNGDYCANCGQPQKNYNRIFWQLISEAFEDIFRLDSRASRTLFALFFRPGYLVLEFVGGRRARYVPPFRLYLITSILLFFIMSLQSSTVSTGGEVNTGAETASPQGNVVQVDPGGAAPDETQTPDESEDAEASQSDNTIVVGDVTIDTLEDLNNAVDKISIDGLSEEENQLLRSTIKAQISKNAELYDTDPGLLLDRLFEVLPIVMFFLMPLFAVFLKIAYLGSHRYYTEHLLLSVYNHSFLFLAILLQAAFGELEKTFLALITGPIGSAIGLWIPVYMFLSLKRVYQQGYLVTLIKFPILFVCHFMLFILGLLCALLWQVMTL
jgi:hypothetical protein